MPHLTAHQAKMLATEYCSTENTVNRILGQILNRSQSGRSILWVPTVVGTVKEELERLGYTIGKQEDTYHDGNIDAGNLISW